MMQFETVYSCFTIFHCLLVYSTSLNWADRIRGIEINNANRIDEKLAQENALKTIIFAAEKAREKCREEEILQSRSRRTTG